MASAIPVSERRAARQGVDQASRVLRLAHRLLTDFARLGYGENPPLDYLPPQCAAVLRDAWRPLQVGDAYVEADYGEAALGSAHFPDDATESVRVELLVDDRSVFRHPDGSRLPVDPARWQVCLWLDPACERITGMRVICA